MAIHTYVEGTIQWTGTVVPGEGKAESHACVFGCGVAGFPGAVAETALKMRIDWQGMALAVGTVHHGACVGDEFRFDSAQARGDQGLYTLHLLTDQLLGLV